MGPRPGGIGRERDHPLLPLLLVLVIRRRRLERAEREHDVADEVVTVPPAALLRGVEEGGQAQGEAQAREQAAACALEEGVQGQP